MSKINSKEVAQTEYIPLFMLLQNSDIETQYHSTFYHEDTPKQIYVLFLIAQLTFFPTCLRILRYNIWQLMPIPRKAVLCMVQPHFSIPIHHSTALSSLNLNSQCTYKASTYTVNLFLSVLPTQPYLLTPLSLNTCIMAIVFYKFSHLLRLSVFMSTLYLPLFQISLEPVCIFKKLYPVTLEPGNYFTQQFIFFI